MSRKTEIQVGATVLVAVAILLWSIAWLSMLARAHVQRVWHVRFPESGGLAEGNEAQVNGVGKGVVKSLRLVGDHVVVDIALARDVVLTRDCAVRIRSVSLMGDKVIAVDYRDGGAPWSPRDTLPGTYEKSVMDVMGEVGRASGSVAGIAAQLDSLGTSLRGEGGLAETVHSFRRAARDLEGAVAENRAALTATLRNFSATSRSAKELVVDRQADLGAALDHFASAAARLDRVAGRLDSLRASLQGSASRLERGEGTVGRLMTDERLYDELEGSVRELRALIADIKEHPRKYLRLSVF